MAEQPSPVLPGPDWPQCTCGRCRARRREESLADGCPCKECQPGSGIDFDALSSSRTAANRAELSRLLRKNDRGTLTAPEETRLDELCHLYLYGA